MLLVRTPPSAPTPASGRGGRGPGDGGGYWQGGTVASRRRVADQQRAVHADRGVEGAEKAARARLRGGHGDLDLALRRDVRVDVQVRHAEVVERGALILDLQPDRLAGIASEEGRGEVVVVRLDVDLGEAAHVGGAVVVEGRRGRPGRWAAHLGHLTGH